MKDEFTLEEIARWYCLIEGVEIIDEHCEEVGENVLDDNTDKRTHNRLVRGLKKYIAERFPAMLSDVEYKLQTQTA